MSETDIIIEDGAVEPKLLDIIESQVVIINECLGWEVDVYDDMQADKIKVMANAFEIIYAAQIRLLEQLA